MKQENVSLLDKAAISYLANMLCTGKHYLVTTSEQLISRYEKNKKSIKKEKS